MSRTNQTQTKYSKRPKLLKPFIKVAHFCPTCGTISRGGLQCYDCIESKAEEDECDANYKLEYEKSISK